MNRKNFLRGLCCSALALSVVTAQATEQVQIKKSNSAKQIHTQPKISADTNELSFNKFFKMPAGAGGLEPTPKLLSLNNKRVRITGFMAHEDDPTAGIFLITSRPANVAEKADGMADDLPAATLAVYMPAEDKDKILSYRPGPWVFTGTLQLGNQEDKNGRISYARLIMDKADIPNPNLILPATKNVSRTASR
ncbi:MAG TPA: hypothetical protein VIZ65_14530 [Cellvibrionaceae bacterium]